MAEKEVCADVVSKANEESSGRVEGESLLLPLLQGLLDAPDNEQTADSGTESGEDLRNGLLIEVQNVLAKLANSLKSSHDMSEDRRNSLLQLVTRLQTGLGSQQSSTSERRSSAHGRFLKKRRHNRHTVGVSSEELEDARRLVEEMGLCRNKTSLEKRNSEGQLLTPQSSNPNIPMVKNATAKPYGSPGSVSPSGTSSSVNTPTEVTGVLQLSNPLNSIKLKEPQTPETVSSNFFVDVQNKAQISHKAHESETDDDLIAAKHKSYVNESILQSNPIYTKPQFEDTQDEQKINRFNNKKLKIKRANTIDIPKPVNIYESEDDYDSDTSLVDKQSSRRNHYLALRGPIRVGRTHVSNTNLPIFEPKTDSDKKFMAFINKHNEKNEQGSLWTQQNSDVSKRGNNWNNRFGNIRTAFEKASVNTSITPTVGMNSARNFWKTADSAASFRKQPSSEVKVNKALQRRSEYIQDDKRKLPWATIEENDVVTGSLKVETKGLDVNKNYKFVPQPLPVNKFSHAPTSAFAAIPRKAVPEIPPSKTTTKCPAENIIKSDFPNADADVNTPLYLYSPKPIPKSTTPSSPSSAPWVNNNCVQKLASAKFENNNRNDTVEQSFSKPKKINKEVSNSSLYGRVPVDKVTAPYINKCADTSNTVRKLSDQFNKIPKQSEPYNVPSNIKPDRTITKLHSYPPTQFHNDYVHYPPSKQDHSYYQSSKPTPLYQAYCNSQYSSMKPSETQYHREPASVNFSMSYDTPKVNITHKEDEPEGYTSQTFVTFTPATPKCDESDVIFANTSQQAKYTRQVSQESVKEYEAAVSKVMKGPVAQQAVTVQQNSPKGRDQHDIEIALNLKNVLQKFSEKSPDRKLSIDSSIEFRKSTPEKEPRKTQSFKKTQSTKNQPNFVVNGKPLSMESTEINENGESVITSKFHIPVTIQSPITKSPSQQMFSKADLWNQLMYDQQQIQRKPAPISSPNAKSVNRSKSSHSLAVPTVQFQAGMTRDEVTQKKKSVEAYFSGSVSPQSIPRSPSDDSIDKSEKAEVKVSKSSINRKKTSEKVSINKQMTAGVSRSQTLPNIVCPDLLDESKVEESFEDLFRSNA